MERNPGLLARSSTRGRLTLTAVTLGTGIAMLDGTVVNIAVTSIGRDLGAGLAALQWVINGYMLSLAALILLGGALGDRYGRRRMYVLGVAGFAVAGGLCAIAPTVEILIAARILQGVFAALLTPGSLAIIQGSFREQDRAAAIGTWAGVSGVASAMGPLLGGWLIDNAGWRWIFAINLPLCALVLVLCLWVPDSRDSEARGDLDIVGAGCGVVALAGSTYLLTSWRDSPTSVVIGLGVVSVAAAIGFVVAQRRPGAMLPAILFRSRDFVAANAMTFLVYAALSAVMFFLVLQLQVTSGYSPLLAGVAAVPITVVMLLLSSRMAVLAARTGPRLPMTVGPLICALGVVLLASVGSSAPYWTAIFPGMLIFALGLAALVSPLTAAVLAAAPNHLAGVASGVNNAVARTGSLLSVAALPAIVGLSARAYSDPVVLTSGYHRALLICAALLALGGVVSWFGLAGGSSDDDDSRGERHPQVDHLHCGPWRTS